MLKKSLRNKLIVFLSLITGMQSLTGWKQANGSKVSFDSTVTMIDGRSNASGVLPGDTICLLKGTRTMLLLSYLHGSRNNPIVILNSGGVVSVLNCVNYGIKFDSCSYVKLSGNGDPASVYGIKINNTVGAGLSVDGLSTDVELEYLEIGKTGLVGIFAKTEPDCQFKSTREKFVLRNLKIHDCFIFDTGMEGMYIGSSKYAGQTITCNGKDTIVLPHLLKGVEVYGNFVSGTGWDAIQVSSADSACAVHDNIILHDSQLEVIYQMSGILLGGGTQASCYNNDIRDGKGDGIDIISLGDQRIFNNLIINPGRTYKPQQNVAPYLKYGFFVGSTFTSASNSYLLAYNTVIDPKSYGVRFEDNLSSNNHISNNILINPGSYGTEGERSYIYIGSSSTPVSMVQNIKTLDISTVGFVDPAQGNFDLTRTSQAVNTAATIAGFEISYDIHNRIRPFAKLYDIGAFECQDSALLALPDHNKPILKVSISPNPAIDEINISVTLERLSNLKLTLLDANGRIIFNKQYPGSGPGPVKIHLETEQLQAGAYSLLLKTLEQSIVRKIILINHK